MADIPVILLDFGRSSRPVTQEDVDNWLEMENRYHFVCAEIEKLTSYVIKSVAAEASE